MRTIQALVVMALWTAVFAGILEFAGFSDNHSEPLWSLGGAVLFVIMLVGNFWIFFAIAKEEPWEWQKGKDGNSE